jgi:ABC-type glycerol-3-phosphate transport system permease component
MNMTLQDRGLLQKRINIFLGYFVLITVTVLITIPIIALVIGSLKRDMDLVAYPIVILPTKYMWENYIRVFQMTPFLKVATRTFLLGFGCSVILTFISAMVGYAFARFNVKGNKELFTIIIALLIVPGIVTLIPQFLVFARLKMTNTYWPWWLGALGGSPYFIFLFRQFFLTFPKELEEAAEVDGCGPLRIFLQIFLPNAKPVIATVMFFSFLGYWGDYLTPLIYLNDDKTLLGVKMATGFRNPKGITLVTVSLAANVYYILPMVIVFFVAQKNILKGVITSGLKG